MYLFYSFGIFGISVLVMWWGLRLLQNREKVGCRGYLVGYLLAGLVPFLVTLLMTLITSMFYFKGTCYGFTEGNWDCSFWDYLLGELYFAYTFFLPAIGLAFAAITLSFAVHWFFNRRGYFQDVQGGE
jgi:hypothetical protein